MVSTRTIGYNHTVGAMHLFRDAPGVYFPVDSALGRDGILWILSRGGSPNMAGVDGLPMKRVTKCTPEGEFLGQLPFGVTASGDDRMMWPVSMVVDNEGNIYISDEGLHRISILDREGNFLRNWGVEGAGDGEFNRPAGIAFDKHDNLLVVDGLNNRVQRYTRDGHFLGTWGRPGSGDGEFNNPWGITVDRAEDVYVADWRNDRIQKFDAEGHHLATWGSPGEGDGEFHRPAAVAVDDDGDMWVVDWGNERVQVFDSEGRFIAKLRGEGGPSIMSCFYFEGGRNTGRHFQPEWTEEAQRDIEQNPPTFDSVRAESASILKYFWGPTSIKVESNGLIYITDSHRHRIQVYRKDA